MLAEGRVARQIEPQEYIRLRCQLQVPELRLHFVCKKDRHRAVAEQDVAG